MNLKEFFLKNPKVAVAFSGGADSAYLIYCAKKYACEVKAYCFKSQFQPVFELEGALRLAAELDFKLEMINADLSDNSDICDNSPLRCYYCKSNMLKSIFEKARADGFETLIDGTNASDVEADRPGMKALKEENILSPLKICGITKKEVYSLSREAGLFTCNKTSYSCLATRIPTGMKITNELLNKIEESEKYLFSSGFYDFRLRVVDENTAKLQLKREQLEKALNEIYEINVNLKKYFKEITVDTEVFR